MSGPYTLGECLAVGIITAALLTLIAAGILALGGGTGLEAAGLTVWSALAAYFASGVLGPLFFWVLQPLTRSRVGAALVGSLVLLPAAIVFAATFSLPPEGRISAVVGVVVLGAFVGHSLGGES